MDTAEYEKILDLIHREVVPAIGCTEPVAVALAVARAREELGEIPDRIEVGLSANVLKNAMGVGIPGTGMIGLPIAIALGALIGKSVYGLEVLKDLNKEALLVGRQMIHENKIFVCLDKQAKDKLFIRADLFFRDQKVRVIISGRHDHICFVSHNDKVIFEVQTNPVSVTDAQNVALSFDKVYEFALNADLKDIHFILNSVELNMKASDYSNNGIFGHDVAKTLASPTHENVLGSGLCCKMMAATAAACDVRMAGAMVPVMSNSGSGNQGIAATLPVCIYAKETGASQESLIRSLILSHLMVIYIKAHLGRLSALCGCVAAATGASCGIVYLMGGSRLQVSYCIQNMIGNITGMICDGAKPSCALKISSSVSTATLSSLMAMDGKVITASEGIAELDVDKTIRNLARIGKTGMDQTDRLVLEIMTHKS